MPTVCFWDAPHVRMFAGNNIAFKGCPRHEIHDTRSTSQTSRLPFLPRIMQRAPHNSYHGSWALSDILYLRPRTLQHASWTVCSTSCIMGSYIASRILGIVPCIKDLGPRTQRNHCPPGQVHYFVGSRHHVDLNCDVRFWCCHSFNLCWNSCLVFCIDGCYVFPCVCCVKISTCFCACKPLADRNRKCAPVRYPLIHDASIGPANL